MRDVRYPICSAFRDRPSMNRQRALRRIEIVTHCVPDLSVCIEAYTGLLDYRLVARGELSPSLCAAWGTPACAGLPCVLLQPARNTTSRFASFAKLSTRFMNGLKKRWRRRSGGRPFQWLKEERTTRLQVTFGDSPGQRKGLIDGAEPPGQPGRRGLSVHRQMDCRSMG